MNVLHVKAIPKENCQVQVQANSANTVIRFPRIWEFPGIFYIRFSGTFYLFTSPVPWGRRGEPGACCVCSEQPWKEKDPAKSLAIGNGWQKEVLSYNGSVCWAEVLSSCNISYRVQNTLRVYSSHTPLLCLQHRLVGSEEICKMVSHLLIYQLKFYIVFL